MFKWFPWKFILRRIARSQGFADPMRVVGKLQKFAQPSEVAAPIELLRLSSVLQIKGLINAQAIQHNLDWIWPHWVQNQFDPRDKAFVPRAFSMTHINLTGRNWTAIGLPNVKEIPIVDPGGLLTPHYDGWSIDCWLYESKESYLAPSRLDEPDQKLLFENGLLVETIRKNESSSLQIKAWVEYKEGVPHAYLKALGKSKKDAWLVFSLRPMNPEGISEIQKIKWIAAEKRWIVNRKERVLFPDLPDKVLFSHYREGDVFLKLDQDESDASVKCDIGMASAAVMYRMKANEEKVAHLEIPLKQEKNSEGLENNTKSAENIWNESLGGLCKLKCPDEKFQFLYDAAIKSLILHAQGEDVYPGPYTYKHFWFRDAAFILEALISVGCHKKTEEVIDSFASRQTPFGHFLSQDGEWDSNGEALWMYERFCSVTGQKPKSAWKKPIQKGAKWLVNKRLSEDLEEIHAGLLPAGFSAEHLGPNDYYYWDDFWGVKGLRATAKLYEGWGDHAEAEALRVESDSFMKCIETSLRKVEERQGSKAMPSSPHRRLDTGSIGSIAVGYPLQLWDPKDERLLATVEYLMNNCMVNDGFFHDMSHSGINPYLTLAIAQVLLRAEDPRYYILMNAIADLASPTGQWPEAIHPQSKGGCMGDGQHIWAAAEWVLMIRNCFVLEEDDCLVLCAGIPAEWLKKNQEISFGPVSTKFGSLTVKIDVTDRTPVVSWEATWFDAEPKIKVNLPELV